MSEGLQKELKAMEERIIATIKQELTPEAREEKRYTKKLHNTKLLLKNYKKFKMHADQAEFTAQNLINNDLIEILGEDYEQDHDEMYIKSILKTKERTAMMLNYITNVLEFYVYSSNNKTNINRAITLKMAYLEGCTQSEIAKELEVDERTVRRYIEEGIKDVAPLMFGIDGVKLSK
ncbi:sigma factor-like helix-turn-helix DNA-binding protein [Niameybacter massiliensis]|uniref:sigma factor-like helix-turn-helix DNA-binding protein n=1 Tax=Niameybacter massiliensis TaxID=1658108 RepID=UPI0006B5171F|nr:sigma factor-like helix-turn-helix DNA-binding protein [Niameybacter massiliensis]